MTERPRIVRTPGTCGGVARLDGHRIMCWLFEGKTVAQARKAWPHLTVDEIETASDYAHSRPREMRQDRLRNQGHTEGDLRDLLRRALPAVTDAELREDIAAALEDDEP